MSEEQSAATGWIGSIARLKIHVVVREEITQVAPLREVLIVDDRCRFREKAREALGYAGLRSGSSSVVSASAAPEIQHDP